MAEQTLVLFLITMQTESAETADSLQAYGVLLNSEGAVIEVLPGAPLATFVSLVKDREVVVVVPAADVLLVKVNLPQLQHQNLRKALPYALEEQLADDVEELHFALGPSLANGEYVVAVVAKQKMQAWIQALREHHIEPIKMLPLSLTLPLSAHTWSVAVLPDHMLVKTSPGQGLVCDNANLQTLLMLKWQESVDKPQVIHGFNYTATACLPLEVAGCLVKERLYPIEQSFTDFSRVAQQHDALNLLQGPYQAKRQWRQLKNTWMVSGILIAACIGMLFFSQIVSYVILATRSYQMEHVIAAIYHRQFPEAQAVVAVKTRMEDKLRKVLTQATGDPLFVLLSSVSQAVTQFPQVHLERFDFQHGQLTLNVTASSFEFLDQFTQFLDQQGMSVKQENAATQGGEVKADLVIQGNT
ncbi:MAG: type II secretion system protein GspL [Gammaproteobacteria bacterium RIFCSPHIGHO2_12_FULL_41_20]|nr:MAG: type II secretion system protein GspL [Gammaproteobacteria bacterium RIFCSPHIGHO2_12_FULL_41_20]